MDTFLIQDLSILTNEQLIDYYYEIKPISVTEQKQFVGWASIEEKWERIFEDFRDEFNKRGIEHK